MELGQPKHLKQTKDGGGLIRTRLEEGDNVHRVLFGPVKISLQYYPTLVEDPTTGEMVQRMKVIRRGNAGTPLDTLSSLEKRIRTGRGEQNASSSLNPSNKWLYLVMDKNDEDYPSVKIAEYPYTVYKKLIELEAAVSIKDSSKLRNGLIFMWDAIITKSVDKAKGIRFGTSYDAQVDPENTFSGKVPVSYLGEVKQLLTDFPIYLGATNPDGSYRFPSVEQFQEQLEKMGIDFLSGEPTQPQLISAKPETNPVEIPTAKVEAVAETIVEEAPVEVVEETPATPEQPEKKKDDDEDFPEW